MPIHLKTSAYWRENCSPDFLMIIEPSEEFVSLWIVSHAPGSKLLPQ